MCSFPTNFEWIENQVRIVTGRCVEISKHYTSGGSFISTQQQSANVLETHLPRHFSSIVNISGWTRSHVVITISAKMFGQKFRSEPLCHFFHPTTLQTSRSPSTRVSLIFCSEVPDEICDRCLKFSPSFPHLTTSCFITLWIRSVKKVRVMAQNKYQILWKCVR